MHAMLLVAALSFSFTAAADPDGPPNESRAEPAPAPPPAPVLELGADQVEVPPPLQGSLRLEVEAVGATPIAIPANRGIVIADASTEAAARRVDTLREVLARVEKCTTSPPPAVASATFAP